MQTIKIKYFNEDLIHIDKIVNGDWIDLRSSENVSLLKGEYYLLPLGVAMELPKGYEAHIVPRSSTFKNFGIIQTNSKGIVDNSYCGNNDQWYMPIIAMRDTTINLNDRVCQFRIVKNQEDITFETVDELESINRGGIGSTGVK